MNTIPERVWKIVLVVLGVLALFLLVISVKEMKSIGYVGKSEQVVNTISVNGKGDAVATPDVATFSFSVSETDKTVTAAQTKATDKINAALKVVKDSGVAEKDIQTLSYNINPHYDYQNGICPAPANGISYPCRPGKNVLTGYDVSQTIQVKVRDLNKAGELFASIGNLNVQNVNGLEFAVDNSDAIKAEARAEAIDDAQKKAKELSRQLGVSLVRITSFYESGDNVPYPVYGMGGGASLKMDSVQAARAPEVPVGEQKVIANVTVTYEIK